MQRSFIRHTFSLPRLFGALLLLFALAAGCEFADPHAPDQPVLLADGRTNGPVACDEATTDDIDFPDPLTYPYSSCSAGADCDFFLSSVPMLFATASYVEDGCFGICGVHVEFDNLAMGPFAIPGMGSVKVIVNGNTYPLTSSEFDYVYPDLWINKAFAPGTVEIAVDLTGNSVDDVIIADISTGLCIVENIDGCDPETLCSFPIPTGQEQR